MSLNIDKEVARMKRMTVGELQDKYAGVFGETTGGRHKQWLIKRIAWRMQANEYGGLSERALARARELANTADLRVIPPADPRESAKPPRAQRSLKRRPDRRVPSVGNVITRLYKGVEHEITVTDGGFEFEGEFYKSLSAIAKKITGQHWNGYRFFRLDKAGARR